MGSFEQGLLFGLAAVTTLSAIRLAFLNRDFPTYWGPTCRRQQHRLVRRHHHVVVVAAVGITGILLHCIF